MKTTVNLFNTGDQTYSDAIIAGSFAYLGGQVGLDPLTGKLVEGGASAQAMQAFRNIELILERCGTNLDSIFSMTVFLIRAEDFQAYVDARKYFLGQSSVAGTAVVVADLCEPGALLEIQVVAGLTA